MSIISPVQSHDNEGSPMSKEEKLRWEGSVEKVGFEPGVKKRRIMRVRMMTEMGWKVKEINRGRTDYADEMKLEVESKGKVMHI